MNWSVFVRWLGNLDPYEAPTDDDLREILLRVAETDDERELIERETLEERRRPIELATNDLGMPLVPVVNFVWYNMLDSGATLYLVDGGDIGILLVWDDRGSEGDLVPLCAVASPGEPGAVARALAELDPSAVIGCRPNEIRICAPHLLPTEMLRAWYSAHRDENESPTDVAASEATPPAFA